MGRSSWEKLTLDLIPPVGQNLQDIYTMEGEYSKLTVETRLGSKD